MPTGATRCMRSAVVPRTMLDLHRTKEKHAVVHCFTGTEAHAAAYIERGMFIGLTGTVCMPRRGATLRAMLCSNPPTIPLDKLLLETDAPFMHPFSQGGVAVPTAADPATVYKPEGGGAQGGKGGARKRRCEPADLTWVIKTVAACYGVSEEHVAMQTAANASTVFGFGGHVNLPSTANLETTSEAVATAVATAAASSGGAQAQRPPTAAASAAAAGGGSTTNFAPELTPLQQECVQQALSSPFVDSHVHLDEVLSALKIGIPGLGDEGGAGGSQEDADLAAAIAASLGHATPPVAQPGATHAAGASSSSSGNDTSASALHPRLAQLVGEPCQGLVAQFCDPASVSPSLGVWEALLCLGGVYGAFGCHPHHAKHYSESWEGRIREALTHPKAVALGECGLDYHRSASPRDVQQQVFARQLLLAVEVGKPVVVHCRNAEADALRIMQEHLPADWLVHLHCYTGNASNAQKFLSAFSNLYIGFTGYITQSHGDAAQTRAAIRDTIPLNRVLFETDGPWMCPRAAGAQADVVAPVLGALYDAGRYRGAKRPGLPGAPAEAGGSKHASARGGKRRGGRSGGGGGGNQQSVGCGKGGRTCHPGCIPAIAAVIAAEKGVSVADAMQQVRRNTSAVYGV